MLQSHVETFNQTGADLQSQSGQFRHAATNALGQRLQAALLFPLVQLRMAERIERVLLDAAASQPGREEARDCHV
jgi:hypothetical protein